MKKTFVMGAVVAMSLLMAQGVNAQTVVTDQDAQGMTAKELKKAQKAKAKAEKAQKALEKAEKDLEKARKKAEDLQKEVDKLMNN